MKHMVKHPHWMFHNALLCFNIKTSFGTYVVAPYMEVFCITDPPERHSCCFVYHAFKYIKTSFGTYIVGPYLEASAYQMD